VDERGERGRVAYLSDDAVDDGVGECVALVQDHIRHLLP
jgi:hypothetical protein